MFFRHCAPLPGSAVLPSRYRTRAKDGLMIVESFPECNAGLSSVGVPVQAAQSQDGGAMEDKRGAGKLGTMLHRVVPASALSSPSGGFLRAPVLVLIPFCFSSRPFHAGTETGYAGCHCGPGDGRSGTSASGNSRAHASPDYFCHTDSNCCRHNGSVAYAGTLSPP